MDNQHCRFCGCELKHTFADLGLSPLSNEYLKKADLNRGQMFYPLNVKVCDQCFLVQAAEYQRPEQMFGGHQYFSSYSESWLTHCKAYVDMIVPRLSLTMASRVLEIACNDGYLLQYFQPYGIPVKGIEPAKNVAAEARDKGIDVQCCFFGANPARDIAAKDGRYDLVIGNNVLAHMRPAVARLLVRERGFGCIFTDFSRNSHDIEDGISCPGAWQCDHISERSRGSVCPSRRSSGTRRRKSLTFCWCSCLTGWAVKKMKLRLW